MTDVINARLDQAAWQRATAFIEGHGTNLHRRLMAYRFQGGDTAAVITALADYQNEDGGFGHGLEPDLRTTHSSVICTTVALQLLAELSVNADHELVRMALGFLDCAQQDGSWPLLTPACNDAPHAPWWTWQAQAPGFTPNADAEILAYRYQWTSATPDTDPAWQDALACIGHQSLEMHDLLCYVRLVHCPALGRDQVDQLLPLVRRSAISLVKTRPVDWEEYGLQPLDMCPTPDSLLMPDFAESVMANLDHLVALQQPDGSWRPAWSWGEQFAETWRAIEPEITALVTLQAMTRLHAHGRLG